MVVAFLVGCSQPGEVLVPSKVDTGIFDGQYELVPEASFAWMKQRVAAEADAQRKQTGQALLEHMAEQYSRFHVGRGVIRSGGLLVQEFSLIQAEVQTNTLKGRAVWHEDVHDPGDDSEVDIMLRLNGDQLEFAFLDEQGQPEEPIVLKRIAGAR
jgi:hypothetical protein